MRPHDGIVHFGFAFSTSDSGRQEFVSYAVLKCSIRD